MTLHEKLLHEQKARELEAGPQHGKAGKTDSATITECQGVTRSFCLPHRAFDHVACRLERLSHVRADIIQIQGTNQGRNVGCILRGGEADDGLGHGGTRTF